MAGVKRRTKYRKNVTSELLNGLPEPLEDQLIVVAKGSRGSNMIEVATPDGELGLCILPTRFRKLVWVRRGSYLIVSQSKEDIDTASGAKAAVRFRVENILFEDQVKHLKKVDKWPAAFADAMEDRTRRRRDRDATGSERDGAASGAGAGGAGAGGAGAGGDGAGGGADDEEEDSDDYSDLFVNRNRAPPSDSSDDGFSDSDDE